MKLTRKQQLFADEYIRTGNAYQSAVSAGYSHNYAKGNIVKLLENVSVKSYIDARLEELKKESIAEQDEILQYLTSVMRGKMTDEELMLVPTGDFMSEVERHEKRADIVARTKAAELLGKRYAMWTEKQEVEHSGAVTFVDDIE
ncbi:MULTISPECIES: terminase small subunit [Mammaliicoccus]|uniref:terminase small subunit n=1 Tax=Mammaliicoccus TaxID=2803850 RepID=UPI000D1F9D55|nr:MULTISPECIES: terminase small subunit [Mammaliicoccus]MBV5103435.1 terminase small subunit [Mammaliicoccus sciuri]MCD8872729.1 terminase small subunit [Mammaliicoccus sciuri]MCJ0918698.1 terminase small subunit [Mammaliicoccus sciuri]MCJ0961282.1 terminase small subunit [Mammaliicoccus sciuri]MEB8129717.1 terminase small subunit [Mammaliicoccus sciuri]